MKTYFCSFLFLVSSLSFFSNAAHSQAIHATKSDDGKITLTFGDQEEFFNSEAQLDDAIKGALKSMQDSDAFKNAVIVFGAAGATSPVMVKRRRR